MLFSVGFKKSKKKRKWKLKLAKGYLLGFGTTLGSRRGLKVSELVN